MRMLVLGAGLQGAACAYDLLREPSVDRVVLADIDFEHVPEFLGSALKDEKLELVQLDARKPSEVATVFQRADACMNALPYYFNLEITRLALATGVHYCDLGGNTAITFKQLELDEEARKRSVSVIPDCGLAPGMGNILAAAGIREMDSADSVKILVGGLPQDPRPPLNYQLVYSLEGVLDYYTARPWVLRDGQPQQVDALSEIETLDFPDPAGTLEAFHTAGGISTMPFAYRDRLKTMEYKTLRYPGHAEIMRAIRELGLLELEPVLVRGHEVSPRELFIACVEPRLRSPGGRDLVVLRVEVEGESGGQRRRVCFELMDFFDEATGISAMERTTGFSLAITGLLQASGQIERMGAHTPDMCVPADAYIRALDRRGVHIRSSMT